MTLNVRRRCLAALASTLLAKALPAGAQARAQPARISWMSLSTSADGSPFLATLRQALRDIGHAEGRNLVIDTFWGEDSDERIGSLLAALLASRPQVIVAHGPAAIPLQRVTRTVPIVFGFSGDPVEAGLVDSFAHPGRNLTGLSFAAKQLAGKRIELIKEALPQLRHLAVLASPQHPGDQAERRESQVAAAALGLTLSIFEARGAAQIDSALVAIEQSNCQAVVAFPVQNVLRMRTQMAAWSVRTRVPVVSGWAQFAEGGNLMTYGANLQASSQRLAEYVDKILKGANPADLPVEFPTRMELVVNLAAAKALNIKLPYSVLLRADRIIE